MTNLEILKNGWNVHISFDKLKNYEICTVVKEIAEENYHWENFCTGDDLWFDGDANLTCTFKDTEKHVIRFERLTALEKFCVALENGMEFDFLHDEETYSQLTKADMRSIIANLLTVIETKETLGTQILEETVKDIRGYAVK
jgi:hypothetical protein